MPVKFVKMSHCSKKSWYSAHGWRLNEECVPKRPPKSPDGESDGYEPSLAPEPEGDVSDTVLNHSILHLPKRTDCPICQEAKQDALPARRVKGPRALTDGHPSEHFGDRIHADHIIVAKGRLDSSQKGFRGEIKCLILYDDFTKIMLAYPAASKSQQSAWKHSSILWKVSIGWVPCRQHSGIWRYRKSVRSCLWCDCPVQENCNHQQSH